MEEVAFDEEVDVDGADAPRLKSEPVLAWEFFQQKNGLGADEAREEWNKLSLEQRAPFLEMSAAYAQQQFEQLNTKKNVSAYQFFIAEESAAAKSAHPDKSLGEITKTILAPRWMGMNSEQKAKYEAMAKDDAERYRKTKKAKTVADTARLANAAHVAHVIQQEPLSGIALYVAANWDSVDTIADEAQREAVIRARWLDLPPEQQEPWLRKAAANQKQHAQSLLRGAGGGGARRKQKEK